MNIQKMMKQAAKMQEQLNEALVEKTVAVSVGGEPHARSHGAWPSTRYDAISTRA